MFRHTIDTSVEFSRAAYEKLPDSRMIETTKVELITDHEPHKKEIKREPYWPDDALVEAVNLAIALGRPLLTQGDPGCGKTRLAYAISYALSLPLEEGYIKSSSRAQEMLYTYDAVTRLYDAQMGENGARKGNEFLCRDARNYIKFGPLGRAIVRAQHGRRSVVLIDEIDKADLDFPNDLLWELDRLEFMVAEAPDMRYAVGDHPDLRPIVIVTHNEEKALPTAFLRRCIFHYMEFPKKREQIKQILQQHPGMESELSVKAINVILRLRELDLNKKPGLSELLDWVGYLTAVKTLPDELNKLPYIDVLLKQRSDQQRAKKEFGLTES